MTSESTSLQEPLLVRPRDVSRLVGLSRTTLWRMVGRQEFPRPVKIGQRAIGWRTVDVAAWISSREVV